jgi:type I restriction enzyme, S subunit
MNKRESEEAVKVESATNESGRAALTSFAKITTPTVEQGGPTGTGQFVYVDISSVDNKLKRITEPKTLELAAAPSRAKQRLRVGDVLVSMTRPNLNAVAMVSPELDGAVGSTGFHVLRPNRGTEPRWLYYGVQTHNFVSAMSELVQGALYPAVRPKDIRAFEIPHPSLDQQKRIVAEIEKQFSRLDEAVANLKRVKANLKRYKAAVLKAAVEGRLVETEAELARREDRTYETGEQLLQRILETRRSQWNGKGKYKEPVAPHTTDLPDMPDGWVWVSWEMVLESTEDSFKRGPFGSALTKAIFVEKGFKVYEQYCPINDDCSFARYYITPERFEELRAFEVCTGDYLISCSGVTLGRITRVPEEFERGIINQALLRVRINEAFVSDEYFLHLFRSVQFQKSIFANSIGSAIPNVKGVKELKAMAIPLPSLAEQKRIVAEVDRRLSLVREVEAQIEANSRRSDRLRQSILVETFSGRIFREDDLNELAIVTSTV